MIQSQAAKLQTTRSIRRLKSAWGANCVVVAETGIAARVCQDYTGLKAFLEFNCGRLGGVTGNVDNMKGVTCFTPMDLASCFTQLENSYEDNRCECGLKSLPSGVVICGVCAGSLKFNGIQNRLGDTGIHTLHVEQNAHEYWHGSTRSSYLRTSPTRFSAPRSNRLSAWW